MKYVLKCNEEVLLESEDVEKIVYFYVTEKYRKYSLEVIYPNGNKYEYEDTHVTYYLLCQEFYKCRELHSSLETYSKIYKELLDRKGV